MTTDQQLSTAATRMATEMVKIASEYDLSEVEFATAATGALVRIYMLFESVPTCRLTLDNMQEIVAQVVPMIRAGMAEMEAARDAVKH